MGANEDIRILMLKECLTLKKLVEKNNAENEIKFTADGLSKKLRFNTLKYSEAKQLAETMGYDLIFKKHKQNN